MNTKDKVNIFLENALLDLELPIIDAESAFIRGERNETDDNGFGVPFTDDPSRLDELHKLRRRLEEEVASGEFEAARNKFFKQIGLKDVEELDSGKPTTETHAKSGGFRSVSSTVLEFPLSDELRRWITDFATDRLAAATPAVYEFQETVPNADFGGVTLSVIYRERYPGSFIFEAVGANDELRNLCLIVVSESGEREPIQFEPTAVGGKAELIISKYELSGLQIFLRRDEE